MLPKWFLKSLWHALKRGPGCSCCLHGNAATDPGWEPSAHMSATQHQPWRRWQTGSPLHHGNGLLINTVLFSPFVCSPLDLASVESPLINGWQLLSDGSRVAVALRNILFTFDALSGWSVLSEECCSLSVSESVCLFLSLRLSSPLTPQAEPGYITTLLTFPLNFISLSCESLK
jgi:hypothetical protein